MITALLLGAVAGLAAMAAYRTLSPPPPPLQVVLRGLDGSRELPPITVADRRDLTGALAPKGRGSPNRWRPRLGPCALDPCKPPARSGLR